MARTRTRKGNPVHGVLLINKPSGSTSNRVLQQVKWQLKAKKAGHTGALDPLATGLLPLCFGEATKFSQLLLDADKTYQVTATLGIQTDTCDVDGEVIATKPIPAFTEADIEQLLAAHFTGTITQVAPIYSALKVNGRPMYELARAGEPVEAKSRQITIFSSQLDAVRPDQVDLTIHCSKGTYIRSIVDELGQLLGCGATVSRLHRTQHGPFTLDQAMGIDDVPDEAFLSAMLPVDAMIADWPVIELTEAQSVPFIHGNPTTLTACDAPSDLQYRVYQSDSQQFVGIGQVKRANELWPVRVINCNS
jgi:tRNA pseudouridine55 synthase